MSTPDSQTARAWAAAAAVCDPELPQLTIADLGVLREVSVSGDAVEVALTPTYSGCPAMATIAIDVELALAQAGFKTVRIRTVLSPAWTTDWLSAQGRRKLAAAGIAPPQPGAGRGALFGVERVTCPRCGWSETELLSQFGSTACKALRRCTACREPFDHFKCH